MAQGTCGLWAQGSEHIRGQELLPRAQQGCGVHYQGTSEAWDRGFGVSGQGSGNILRQGSGLSVLSSDARTGEEFEGFLGSWI